MDYNLKLGITYESKQIVEEKNTAAAYGSGSIFVFATPAMIGLMENAALKCADEYLPEGFSTVGTELNVKHIAATPMGMEAKAVAELIEIDGRRLVFRVEAFDEDKKIGTGTHERFIIDVEKFMSKLNKL